MINAWLSCCALHSLGTFDRSFKNDGIIGYNDFINVVPVFITINLKLITLIFWVILSWVVIANNNPEKIWNDFTNKNSQVERMDNSLIQSQPLLLVWYIWCVQQLSTSKRCFSYLYVLFPSKWLITNIGIRSRKEIWNSGVYFHSVPHNQYAMQNHIIW